MGVAGAAKKVFDKIVIINLKRRPDRLEESLKELSGWCFRKPEIFAAIDGDRIGVPATWQSGGGAWGCRESHLTVLRNALMDDTRHLLVLEDDVVLCSDFAEKVKTFLANVPKDYDGFMLSGQHLDLPIPVNEQVVKCQACERTSAYSVRGRYMRGLYAKWSNGDSQTHIDWVMGRGGTQRGYNIYAPTRFLIGQRSSRSDISGSVNPTKFWNHPDKEQPVVILDSPHSVVKDLRDNHGWHFGYNRNKEDIDVGLVEIVRGRQDLRRFLQDLTGEVFDDSRLKVFAIWHPENPISAEQVRGYWKGKVIPIKADTTEGALLQWTGV